MSRIPMSDEPASRRQRRLDEHAHRQAELRQTELINDAAFTRSVLATSSEAIKVLDLEARIEFMSVGALRTMAIDDEDDIVATSWLAMWPDDAERATAAIA